MVVIGSVTARTGTPLEGTATLHTLLGHLGVHLSTLHTLSGGHKVSRVNRPGHHLSCERWGRGIGGDGGWEGRGGRGRGGEREGGGRGKEEGEVEGERWRRGGIEERRE